MSASNATYHAQPAEEVLQTLSVRAEEGLSVRAEEGLSVRAEEGLSDQEANSRQKEHGPNQLRRARRRSVWKILLGQFKSVVILVLAAAAVVAFLTWRWPEGYALLAVIVVNTLIGFFSESEWRAVWSMEALRAMARRKARVRRGGREKEVGVAALVPGDIVLVSAEDLVPADLRLVKAEKLRIKEAALTGESVPVNKRTEPVDADAPFHRLIRSPILFHRFLPEFLFIRAPALPSVLLCLPVVLIAQMARPGHG